MTRRSRQKAARGASPGTLIYTGAHLVEKAKIQVYRYTEEEVFIDEPHTIEEGLKQAPLPGVTWINVDGIADVETVTAVGRALGIHPLALEDVLTVEQRPKFEEHDRYAYAVAKMMTYDEKAREVQLEQVGIFLCPEQNVVVTFQEKPGGDVFDPVRARIKGGKGRMRRGGADYLAYALIDAIVDNVFAVVERVGTELDKLEDRVVEGDGADVGPDIHYFKSQLLALRRAVWPLRDVLAAPVRGESPHFRAETRIYLRDVHDHALQAADTVETHREIARGLEELYRSAVTIKTNEVIKVLTVISTIFIPLTFLTGVYGMNFERMPELATRWGYPAVWTISLLVAGTMLVYFRRRGWI